MKTVFIPREISELENGSIILLSGNRHTVKQLHVISANDKPIGYEFLAVPIGHTEGSENKKGRRISVPEDQILMSEESVFSTCVKTAVTACFLGGMIYAGLAYLLNWFINS